MELKKEDLMKIAGIGISIAGFGLSMASEVLSKKEMDMKIKKEVADVIGKMDFTKYLQKTEEC